MRGVVNRNAVLYHFFLFSFVCIDHDEKDPSEQAEDEADDCVEDEVVLIFKECLLHDTVVSFRYANIA